MIDLSPVLEIDFWFRLNPLGLSPFFERSLFFLFALLIIMGSVSRIVARNRKEDYLMVKAYRHMGQMFLTMGVIGMFWFFFTFEQIYLFGARFWFLVWLVCVALWVAWIVRYVKVTIPQLRQAGTAKKDSNKYIPSKKRR
jgi:Ca2+/Na+ antiporter